jgi:hypothetical protein
MVEAVKDLPWFDVEGHKKFSPGKLPKFSSALNTPIVQSLSELPVVDGVANLDDAMSSIVSQRIDKLILLLKHYKIENADDPWLWLSFRLACHFVPGMTVLRVPKRGRGRPAKWKGQAGDDLVAAVDAEKDKTGSSIASAINNLKKTDPKRWGAFNEQRYYEARRDGALRRAATVALRKTEAEIS